jgi:hypothetical protein
MNQEKAMDPLPEVRLCHFSTGRLRIRIDRRRGDGAYFQGLQEKLAAHSGYAAIATNPVTGSVLVEDVRVSPAEVASFGREAGLFELDLAPRLPRGGVQNIISPLKTVDVNLRHITGGTLDVPSAVFVALVIFGVIEILRGNFKTPPWYTAFWYAFGVFTKTLMENRKA